MKPRSDVTIEHLSLMKLGAGQNVSKGRLELEA